MAARFPPGQQSECPVLFIGTRESYLTVPDAGVVNTATPSTVSTGKKTTKKEAENIHSNHFQHIKKQLGLKMSSTNEANTHQRLTYERFLFGRIFETVLFRGLI